MSYDVTYYVIAPLVTWWYVNYVWSKLCYVGFKWWKYRNRNHNLCYCVVPLAFRKRCEWFADKIDWCSLYIRNIRDTCVYHSVSMRTRPHLSANALSSVPRIFELHKTLVADDIRWYPHYIRNTFAIRARYIRDTYARLNQCIRDIRNYPQLIRN